jgi:hypothetical protein
MGMGTCGQPGRSRRGRPGSTRAAGGPCRREAKRGSLLEHPPHGVSNGRYPRATAPGEASAERAPSLALRARRARSCRSGDPGSGCGTVRPGPSPRESTHGARTRPSFLLRDARLVPRAILSMPLTCSSTLDRRLQLRCCRSVVLRGGALEPGALVSARKSQAKATGISGWAFSLHRAQRNLSLSGGASSPTCLFQAKHHLPGVGVFGPETTKATYRSPSLHVTFG